MSFAVKAALVFATSDASSCLTDSAAEIIVLEDLLFAAVITGTGLSAAICAGSGTAFAARVEASFSPLCVAPLSTGARLPSASIRASAGTAAAASGADFRPRANNAILLGSREMECGVTSRHSPGRSVATVDTKRDVGTDSLLYSMDDRRRTRRSAERSGSGVRAWRRLLATIRLAMRAVCTGVRENARHLGRRWRCGWHSFLQSCFTHYRPGFWRCMRF